VLTRSSLPPSPPAEQATARQDQSGKTRAIAERVNGHLLLERNGTPEKEPEGQALQTRAYSWAEKLLRRHEAKVERVANSLLQPPHKMNPARFKQLMREG
jgi:hypothetical protein